MNQTEGNEGNEASSKDQVSSSSCLRALRFLEHLPEIDARITRYCENYEFRRISAVDRNVLRLGIYEMFYRNDIPPVVSIYEAIELAKEFGGAPIRAASSTGFSIG